MRIGGTARVVSALASLALVLAWSEVSIAADDAAAGGSEAKPAEEPVEPARSEDEAGSAQAEGADASLPAPSLEIYGFAQLDSIYDFQRVDKDWDATLRPSTIPVHCDGAGDSDAGCGRNSGNMIFSVRQSRFGVKGHVPTAIGQIDTIFEFDLFGVGSDAGKTTFRLRHAWGQLGQFGGGQTWSLFMDPDVFPNTVDYWGPSGMIFLRNPQLRWTPIQREDLSVAVALEAPGAAIDEGKLRTTAPELDADGWNSYPDVTAQIRKSGDWGHVQLAGIFRMVGYQVTNQPGRNSSGHEPGGGLNASTVLEVFEADSILLQFAGGYGFANYLNDGGTDIAPDNDTPVRGAQTLPMIAWLAYYNRTWSERFTSSIGVSEVRQWTLGGQDDGAFATSHYASTNLLFHPIKGLMVGPEYLWGRLNVKGGEDETDNRLQLTLKYAFGVTVGGGKR